MNLRDVIRNWFAVSQGQAVEPDPFFQFMSAWIAFNAFFILEYGIDVTDRTKVDSFKQDETSIHRHLALVADDDEYRDAVLVLAEQGVVNMRNERRVEIQNPNDFSSVIEAVYTVRCNLFHGEKMTDNARDRDLVTASHRILMGLSTVLFR